MFNTISEINLFKNNANKHFHDINRIAGDGLLILPISMSNLQTSQTPIDILTFIDFFLKKSINKNIDIIILYTNGLYYNSDEPAYIIREKLANKIHVHKNELIKTSTKYLNFPNNAIHVLPWDYVTLNSVNYSDCYSTLQKAYFSNAFFRTLIELDSCRHKKNMANWRFVLEELVVTYIIRNKLITFPSALAQENGWVLIAYPGTFFLSDIYFYKENLYKTKLNHFQENRFSSGFYDILNNVYVDFRKIKYDAFTSHIRNTKLMEENQIN